MDDMISLVVAEEAERTSKDDEGVLTTTLISQKECEESCLAYLKEGEQDINRAKSNGESFSLLLREKHLRYCRRGLEKLGRGFTALDASKPWLMYWMIHSISLLDGEMPDSLKDRVVETLSRYQNVDTGGFGGGYLQLSHCAPTYSGVLALMSIGTEKRMKLLIGKNVQLFSCAKVNKRWFCNAR